jgi:hypothetical protein
VAADIPCFFVDAVFIAVAVICPASLLGAYSAACGSIAPRSSS